MTVPIENLMKNIGNRYRLVLASARRANDLLSQGDNLELQNKKKVPTIALEEIAAGVVKVQIKKSSKKS